MQGLDKENTTLTTKAVKLTWGAPVNLSLDIDEHVIANSAFFSQTLKLDPDCKELSMPSFENHSITIAKIVFELHHKLIALPTTKQLHLYVQRSEIGLFLDTIAVEPGVLRLCCDFARVLLLEPTFSVLEFWLSYVLCGLNLTTIEQWISKGGTVNDRIQIAFEALLENKNKNKPNAQAKSDFLFHAPVAANVKLESCSAAIKKKALKQVNVKRKSERYKEIPLFIS